jgi:hypothetical protein
MEVRCPDCRKQAQLYDYIFFSFTSTMRVSRCADCILRQLENVTKCSICKQDAACVMDAREKMQMCIACVRLALEKDTYVDCQLCGISQRADLHRNCKRCERCDNYHPEGQDRCAVCWKCGDYGHHQADCKKDAKKNKCDFCGHEDEGEEHICRFDKRQAKGGIIASRPRKVVRLIQCERCRQCYEGDKEHLCEDDDVKIVDVLNVKSGGEKRRRATCKKCSEDTDSGDWCTRCILTAPIPNSDSTAAAVGVIQKTTAFTMYASSRR